VRRTVLLLATTALVALSMGAAAAFAQDQIIRCHVKPCYGSGNYDLIYERPANGLNDKIIMKGGNDRVLANKYRRDRDVVFGGSGFDKINVADGDKRDTASGSEGRDWCIVDSRAELGASCARVTIR
jgi:hypothetical protein